MTLYVALLCAVSVGGTRKLAMGDLVTRCREAGPANGRTNVASGNAVFASDGLEAEEGRARRPPAGHAGREVGVLLRTAAEMAGVAATNPFPGAPGRRVTATFLDGTASPDMLAGLVGRAAGEELALGPRVIYAHSGSGIAATKLRIPAAADGTARNMKAVA